MWWIFLICSISLLYVLLIFSFFLGWERLKKFNQSQHEYNLFISILIPFRNEAGNLDNLLHSLVNQDLPIKQYEIVLVNDHSTDNSYNIVNEYSNKFSNLRIFNLPDEMQGKKQALYFGIAASKGELIVTTDADCTMGRNWLSTIASFANQNKPELIIGPIAYHNEKGIFENMQSLDVLSMVASGAGAAALKSPILCNGANLAFSRSLYLKAYENMNQKNPSGDDIFLLQEAKKLNKSAIQFLKSDEAIVYTKPVESLSEFLSQRKRWTSKSRYYKDKFLLFTSFIVFTFNLLICAVFIASFACPTLFFLYFVLLLTKSLVDWPLLFSFSGFLNKRRLLYYFLPTQIIYPFYIVFMVVYGNIGNVEWKKRIYLKK